MSKQIRALFFLLLLAGGVVFPTSAQDTSLRKGVELPFTIFITQDHTITIDSLLTKQFSFNPRDSLQKKNNTIGYLLDKS